MFFFQKQRNDFPLIWFSRIRLFDYARKRSVSSKMTTIIELTTAAAWESFIRPNTCDTDCNVAIVELVN